MPRSIDEFGWEHSILDILGWSEYAIEYVFIKTASDANSPVSQ